MTILLPDPGKTARRLVALAGPMLIVLAGSLPASELHWPSFRGPQARGLAEEQKPPERWDVPTGKNLRWKTPIPGLGLSSPVMWGDRLFVTTAVGPGDAKLKVGLYGDTGSVTERGPHRWQVFCLSVRDGRILWQRTVREGLPRFKRHPKSSHANPSPATDGQRVVFFFGSEGLYCFDLEGRLLWQKDLGPLDSGYFQSPSEQWGFASSPVIHGNLVLVQCDVQTDSFLAAFDARDGRQVWRSRRSDVPTWSTPTVVTHGGRTQLVANGYRQIAGYELASGRQLWRLDGGGDIPVPTPIYAHGLIFITSAHGPRAPIYAIRAEATGDISLPDGQRTNTFIVWSTPRRGNYMQTPIVVGEHLYCCSDSGVLACYEARTGKELYRERLARAVGFTASPVAADGKLFCTAENGAVRVVATGPRFLPLATNELGEPCLATPAIAADMLFFRTRHHLMAIGADSAARSQLQPAGSSADWPCWRGPARNGVSAETNWFAPWPTEGPQVLWRAQVGIGFATVAVSQGRLFTVGNSNDVDTVFCLDAATGQLRWRHSYPCALDPRYYEGGPSATPTVEGEAVYTLSKKGHLFRLEAATGRVVWSKDLTNELGLKLPEWSLAGSPLVEGDLLILNAGGAGTAVDKHTGRIAWTSSPAPAGYATPVPFEYRGRRAIAIFSARALIAVEPRTGRQWWRFPWESARDVNAADPIIAADRLFLASSSGCALLQLRDGPPTVLWSHPDLMRSYFNPAVFVDGALYGIDGTTHGPTKLTCLDWATGKLRWSQPGFGSGGLMAADGKLVVFDKGQLSLVAANPDAFRLLASAQLLGGKCWTMPVLSGGRIYARNAAGELVCVAAGGTERTAH